MERITKIEAVKVERKKKRVAAYARVSTDSAEQLLSLETQKNHYEKYIRSNPAWDFAGLYYDEGITGTKLDKRDGLLRLLSDCDNGLIDYIIVKSISRFSRNTVDCIETVRHLCEIGVYIFFEKENIDTGKMEGELLLSILSSLAESESRSISDNENWSIQKRFQNGTYKIAYPPYGYKSEAGEMVIVPEQAEIVRWIFSEIAAGKSTHTLAKELNSRGIPTKKNAAWTSTVISAMVRNEKYIGDVRLQKTWTDERFTRHMNHGEKAQYYIENHHEPIISHEEFEAANRVLAVNAGEKGIKSDTSIYLNRYAFSGNIICGECGGKYKRRKLSGFYGYACANHIEDRNSCGNIGAVPEDSIKAAFVTMMNKLTFGRNLVLIPYRNMLKATDSDEALSRLSDLDRLLEENADKKRRLVQFFSKGYIDPAVYAEENDSLIDEESKLNTERSALAKQINGAGGKKEALTELLRYTAKGRTITEFDENLYKKHVDHIVVFNRTEIGFAMKCGPVFRERIK